MLGYINSSKACEMHKVSFLLSLDWCGLSWGTTAHYRHCMAAKEWISRGVDQILEESSETTSEVWRR